MNYIVFNTKTRECLCQSIPVDFRCYEYWMDTIYTSYTGRQPIGTPWSTNDIERAKAKCTQHPNCEVAVWDACMNQIRRMAV